MKPDIFITSKLLVVFCFILILSACIDDVKTNTENVADEIDHYVAEKSTFFSTVFVAEKATHNIRRSNGDLWPAAWSDDDFLYTANGDGTGFDYYLGWADIVVNRLSGHPEEENITGDRLASGQNVSQVWTSETQYNKKPTGMVSVEGDLYMAVQDLNKAEGPQMFNDAPAATIIKSADKGETWSWDTEKPMFDDHVFTTIMFLDYGKDGELNTFDDYVYAYGMDYNWRDSFSNTVPDPNRLYLARMPKDGLQNVDTWEFYTGDLDGNQQWSVPGDIGSRRAVLQDDRRVYDDLLFPGQEDHSVISQGSIVYNEGLDRYIYSSWTEYTFEFYESPTPWGPWKRFLSKEFGLYPWNHNNYGGYATVIPSKYISKDGQTMWVNSQTFAGGYDNYEISFRKLSVTPYVKTTPENKKGKGNLALPEFSQDVTPIAAASHTGSISIINDGSLSGSETSWTGNAKKEDWWGYTWSHAYNLNKLLYTTGEIKDGGGWFEDLKVQVRQHFEWIHVNGLKITPNYPHQHEAGENVTYTLTFDDIWGDGVRIIGTPGGSEQYTTISELEVYYAN